MGPTGTTRRRVLAVTGALGAGALAGCSDGADTRGRAPGAETTRETVLRKRLAAASGTIRDHYDATIRRHPQLTARLAPLRASAAAHMTALGGTTTAPATAPSGAPAAPPAVPADPAAALTALAGAERRAAAARTTALADAGPELARLLASLAAASATHVYLLTAQEGAA
ncbi:hypothetical protein ACFVIM_18770 [Streptomyces sp. NPDC057638]|uniref:hypothetical protein n=1 Tax=Streptomyces sp. NPDC057638 TaxID=3346190 RepID=UPI00367A1031